MGEATAKRWAEAGCRTLADVRRRAAELDLTQQQRVGGAGLWARRHGRLLGTGRGHLSQPGSGQLHEGSLMRRVFPGHLCSSFQQILSSSASRRRHCSCPALRFPAKMSQKRLAGMRAQVGLKYYEDMRQRIPRAEVAAALAACQEEAYDAVEAWGARDAERTLAVGAGSYRRGSADSSAWAGGLGEPWWAC